MKRKFGIAAALVVALAITGYAQKPDFSGTWTPDMSADTAGGGGMGGGRGMAGPMTVKQTADTLTIERQGPNGAMTMNYKLDGSESDITMGQMTAKASAKWDGNNLVITIKSDRGEQTQTWSMADGKLTIQRTGGRGPSTMTYKKTT
ncbi:MAG TPA: hypothetical protein VL484_18480 [Vicinamibacterales bacterium]|jgi:hypothetical protein|nr:hypothetical protein [Vicinamibacterales bacterium]